MVQVAQSAPVLACVIVCAQRLAVLGSPLKRGTAIVVLADVGGLQPVSHTLIHLIGESHPVAGALAMVDDHIGDGADAFTVECADHR